MKYTRHQVLKIFSVVVAFVRRLASIPGYTKTIGQSYIKYFVKMFDFIRKQSVKDMGFFSFYAKELIATFACLATNGFFKTAELFICYFK